MTPDQQRIEIATACGWTDTQIIDGKYGQTDVPDYIGDLNAMHEAEKVLTDKGVNAWWAYVANINRNNPRPFGSETAVHATAAQKAEAFLRTLNLWTTTPTKPQ
jgi:hypothetical protein